MSALRNTNCPGVCDGQLSDEEFARMEQAHNDAMFDMTFPYPDECPACWELEPCRCDDSSRLEDWPQLSVCPTCGESWCDGFRHIEHLFQDDETYRYSHTFVQHLPQSAPRGAYLVLNLANTAERYYSVEDVDGVTLWSES